jgi:tRNA (guanine-N7-)-methyltransferase
VNAIQNPAGEPPAPRRIKSFVLRAGRLGPGQQRALAELGPRFVLPYVPQPLDFATAFGRQAPTVLEIGFGMGDATAAVAAAAPQRNFIGVEVHEPGVGALLKRIGEQGLGNIRIVRHDAVEVLEHMLAPASLAGVHVWFPDPWHKARHHKRRLIQPPLVALLASRLATTDEVRTTWPEAGPRGLGSRLRQADQLMVPVQAVISTIRPKTIRYHAKTVKSCVET